MSYRRHAHPAGVNITPMLDVLLVLVVVLIAASPLALKRMPLDPPPVSATFGGAARHWVLGLDAKGTWYLDGRAVPFEAIRKHVPPGASVELAADGSLAYTEVARALSRLQEIRPSAIALSLR